MLVHHPMTARARCLVVAITALAMTAILTAGADARTGYPKVANYHLTNNFGPGELEELAQWDLLVLDADFERINPGGMALLRSINPDIILLGYIPINGTWVDGYLQEPHLVVYKFWEGIDAGNFWLRDVNGDIVNDWPGKGSTNITVHSRTNPQGEHYWEWFPRFVYEEVWEAGAGGWDGLFLDDVWDSVSWLNNLIDVPIDANEDGIADANLELDGWWGEGNSLITSRLRQLVGPDVMVMGNGGNTLYEQLNGAMIENFPFIGPADQDNIYGYSWQKWMFTAPVSYFNSAANYNDQPATVIIVNSAWIEEDGEPVRTGRFEAHKRFCLGSVLLGDGYFSFDADWDDHASLWWEPEYDIQLGSPLGPAYEVQNGGTALWRRDYEQGLVVVNPNNATSYATMDLPLIGPWDAYIGPPPDLAAPEPVTVITAEPLDANRVRLVWEAPADVGSTGRVARYSVRFATWPIETGPPWFQATVFDTDLVPRPAGQPETLVVEGLLPETDYWFAVRSYDAWDNISPLGVVPSATTFGDDPPPPEDTTPPAAVDDLAVTDIDTVSATAVWSAPGDDGDAGSATAYHARIAAAPITEATWDAADPVPGLPPPAPAGTAQSVPVTGLAPGTTYHLALRAEDEAGNVGLLGPGVSFTTDTPPPPADTTGPAVINDLYASARTQTWIRLGFSAPADAEGDVTAYDLRFVEGAGFDPGQWDGATAFDTPAPGAPGTPQSVTVGGLAPGTDYAFRIRAVDDAGNWSGLSAALATSTVTPPPPDTTGPAQVDDLTVAGAGETWLDLAWTAPADAEGTVAFYELRYVAGELFDAAAWESAMPVEAPAPSAPGAAESHRVDGLLEGSAYSFRIRGIDGAANPGLLSDSATGTTTVPPPPPPPADTTAPAVITDLAATVVDTYLVRLTWTAPGDDGPGGGRVASYDLRRGVNTLTVDTWDAATPIVAPAFPAPAGTVEILLLEDLPQDTSLAFAIVAEDSAGNRSDLSNVATAFVTVPRPPDTQPPLPVRLMAAQAETDGAVSLRWSPAPEPDLSHYRIYRARRVGGALALLQDGLDTCEIQDPRVVPGRGYRYAVTAVDASGNESAFSEVFDVDVPYDPFERPGAFLQVAEAFPNPTAGPARLALTSGGELSVEVDVYDVTGRRVRVFPARALTEGDHLVEWDGTDGSGRRVRPGVYFLRVRSALGAETRKVHVLR